MRARSGLALAPLIAALLAGCGQPGAVGQPAPPAGYTGPFGPIPLNPAHAGTQGSTFSQDCENAVPPPAPGGVLWHFRLPQSVLEFEQGGTPGTIFAELTVTFATAGPVTVVFPDTGPPSDAHAWVYTDTDDTLLIGISTFFRHDMLVRGNEPSFNLSHTCFVPPDTTTTAAPTTMAPPTTAAPTTASPTTVSPTTASPTTASPTTAVPTSVDPAGGGTTTTDPELPTTGSTSTTGIAAMIAVLLGLACLYWARRPS